MTGAIAVQGPPERHRVQPGHAAALQPCPRKQPSLALSRAPRGLRKGQRACWAACPCVLGTVPALRTAPLHAWTARVAPASAKALPARDCDLLNCFDSVWTQAVSALRTPETLWRCLYTSGLDTKTHRQARCALATDILHTASTSLPGSPPQLVQRQPAQSLVPARCGGQHALLAIRPVL